MKFEELLQRIRIADEKINEQYGEILAEDEDETSILDESVEWWVNHLAVKYAEEKSKEAQCDELAAKYAARSKSFAARAEWRKKGLAVLADISGHTVKVAGGTLYKSRAQSTVEIPDESAVPEEFMETKKVVNKAKVNKAVKDGLKGNWFTVKDGKEFIVIKV